MMIAKEMSFYTQHAFASMDVIRKRLFVPKRIRADLPYTKQKWTADARKLFVETMEATLQMILKQMNECRLSHRMLSPNFLLMCLNLLCLEGTTSAQAMARLEKKVQTAPLHRSLAIYQRVKGTITQNSVCNSTIQLLMHFMDILADDLLLAAQKRALEGKHILINDRDIQIACLDVPNICILLEGRNDAAYMPALTTRTKSGFQICQSE
jgi:hypothetical protein